MQPDLQVVTAARRSLRGTPVGTLRSCETDAAFEGLITQTGMPSRSARDCGRRRHRSDATHQAVRQLRTLAISLVKVALASSPSNDHENKPPNPRLFTYAALVAMTVASSKLQNSVPLYVHSCLVTG